MKSWLCLYCLCVCELAPQLYVPNVYRARTTGAVAGGGAEFTVRLGWIYEWILQCGINNVLPA